MSGLEFSRRLIACHSAAPPPRLAWWEPRTLLVAANGACHECGHQIDEASLCSAWLVSPVVGGHSSRENLLALCPKCANRQRPADWVGERRASSPDVRELLSCRRLQVLEGSHNHLLRWPTQGRTMAAVRRQLAARWEHERCVVYADQAGLVGWPTDLPPSLTVLAKVRTTLPRVSAPGATKVFQTTGPEDLWALIELGAWVRCVDPEPVIVPGQGEWPITYMSVGDIHRRRPKATQAPRYPQDRMLDALQRKFRTGRPVDFDRLDEQVETDRAWQRKAAASLRRPDH